MRIFLAVEVEGHIRVMVSKMINESGIYKPPWRWIPVENYHLTMKFLGEVREDGLDEIIDTCHGIASNGGPSFEIGFADFGAFPSISNPRVLFYEVKEGSQRLSELASSIDSGMGKLRFPKEKRKFHPHLTLARVKKRIPPAILEKLESMPPLPKKAAQPVESFNLMRSHLSPSGARYEKIAEFRI